MELSVILNLVSIFVLLIGILFGLVQLRHYHLTRKRESSLYLLNSFQTVDFLHGIWITQELPKGLNKKEIEERLGKDIRFIYLVMSTWESIGILLFNREITFDMVDHAYSGPINFSWEKLDKYVTDLRIELKRETPFEWFQWLAERMIEREKIEAPVPAHIAYRDWE